MLARKPLPNPLCFAGLAVCICSLAGGVCNAQRYYAAPNSASPASYEVRGDLSLLPPVDLPSAVAGLQAPRLALASPNEEIFNEESLAATEILPPPSPQMYYAIDDTLGPSIRVFEPKARVYFDTGWEAPDKLDIFHDGSLAPSINFLELFWAKQWDPRIGRPDWRWGPNIGVGISSRAGDSDDGTTQASGAPVLLMSYGFLFEFPLTSAQTDYAMSHPSYGTPPALGLSRFAPKAGIEFGYALGVSSDETLDYSADGALYVGVSLHVTP